MVETDAARAVSSMMASGREKRIVAMHGSAARIASYLRGLVLPRRPRQLEASDRTTADGRLTQSGDTDLEERLSLVVGGCRTKPAETP
jgi:hypothetical protein